MAALPDPMQLLVEYLRIDTTNPPGNEEAGAAWMAAILEAAGIEHTVLVSGPGRGNVVARLRSADPSDAARRSALCLLNHIDVVPADATEWSVDPFGAVTKDGAIWARGAIDMKGMGIMQLLAVLSLARDHTPLTRDVLFVASADEETGGAMGAKWLLDHHPELMACSDVINEGGYGLRDSKPPVMACGLSEKSILQLRLSARGTAGHASMPPVDQALVRLVAALHDLAIHPPRLTLDPLVVRTLQVMADRSPPLRRRALQALLGGRGERLLPLVARRLSRHERAVLGNVVSLTQIDAGYKVNVVPGRVAASIDCRLLPGTPNDQFLAELRARLARYDVEIETVILSDTASGASDGPLLPVLQKVCEEEFPDAVFAPTLFPAFTDSRFFRRAGADAYGLVPVMLSDAEVAGFHGVDERIPIDGFLRGVEVMERIVRKVCT